MAGPQSFALDSNGNVVLGQSNLSSQGVGTQLTGSTGSGAVQGGVASRSPDNSAALGAFAQTSARTIDALNSLTQGALQPLIDAERKKQYFDGMSRVAQGQSLIAIEKEQPWYSQIFGPSATVQGAQAMAANTAITQSQTDFMNDMPELRKQSPDQVRQYLVNKAANIGMTGDPLVDATVQAKLAESWGPMLKTHTKEHVAWQQEDMFNKQVNMGVSLGVNLKAQRHANQQTGWDEKDKQREYDNFVASMQPAPGQTEQSWRGAMTQILDSNLKGGNFDAYNAIKQSELWGKLDVAQRERLDASLEMYTQKDALTNPDTTKLYENRAGLEFQLQHGTSGLTHDALNQLLDRFDQKQKDSTGGTAMFNNEQRAHMHKLLDAGDLAMGKQLAAAGKTQAKYDSTTALFGKAFNSGNAAMLKGIPLDEKAGVDFMNASFAQEIASNDPQRQQVWFDKAAQVSHDPKMRSANLEGIFQTQLAPLMSGNGPATPAMAQALNFASMLYHSPRGGAGAVAAYMDGDTAPKVVAMLQSGADLQDPKQLQQMRELIARGSGAVVQKTDKDAATAYVSQQDPGWLKRITPFFGGPGSLTQFDLNDGNKQALAEQMAPKIAMYGKAYNIPAKDAAPMVLHDLLQNADMVPGAFVFHNAAVPGDTSFASAVNRVAPGMGQQGTELYQRTMKEMIGEKLTEAVKAKGGDMSHFDPNDFEVRSGEQLGNGRLMLFMSSKAYPGLQMITLDAGASKDDPSGFAYRLTKNATKPPPKKPYQFGPDNTFLTQERQAAADRAFANGWK
ncbi:MAG: hypothetical protein GAK35_02210 [Herbaspirillum frisingense]|uniref:Uncharacterized protein n=1 Tax=Herbaspirillum frisingense TaxID=92645 RepID=A0A7V8FWJ5_9BURK|nr:MAG: hypothetical protein GAK35_02210 [Herbaspirillum frisingense]